MRLPHVPFLCVLVAGSVALAEDRPAAAILAELEQARPPEMADFKNKGGMADWPQWFVAAGQVPEFAELHGHSAALILDRERVVAAIAGPMNVTKEVDKVLARSSKP